MTEDKDKAGDKTGEFAKPFSIRLTAEERRQLDEAAGARTIGEYVRMQLFHQQAPRKRAFRRPVQDAEALGQVLGTLGRSRLPSNVNQIAKSVNEGSLPVGPETEQAIRDACAAIVAMQQQLTRALGLPEDMEGGP